MKPTSKQIWSHNGFLGQVTRARTACGAIIKSRTATNQSKALAKEALNTLTHLTSSLRTRIDQEK